MVNLQSSELNKISCLNKRIKNLIETRDLYLMEHRKRDAQAVELMAVQLVELKEKIRQGQFVPWEDVKNNDEEKER